ncbi:TspO/MBR family protein [Clostridium facile]|uniref:Tryptophan-rich sensory protein n=1 Tax=Clostridium facile TaxID=2763035 RepID=A0ABR7IPH9_9CLOT|nr:TspO/MBR family protein [Clostridium facile]MBC5786993.1 tryptophan-rich sensory protein [Clostridium facile]
MKKTTKIYLFSIVFTLLVGGISGLLIRDGINAYDANIIKPPLTPPNLVFPIVWSILYLLMGIGIACILTIDGPQRLKTRTLLVYIAQLFFNFCWSLIFFNAQAFLFAFIWLIALWILILIMILLFAKQSKWAAWLQLPYLIWVSFAGYLNLGVWILN